MTSLSYASINTLAVIGNHLPRQCGIVTYTTDRCVAIAPFPHSDVLEARLGAWWDANKIGLSPPLIETSEGWLMIYHGVRHPPGGCLYRMYYGGADSCIALATAGITELLNWLRAYGRQPRSRL